jgi:hypothetical protein
MMRTEIEIAKLNEQDHQYLQDLMILVDQRNIERFEIMLKRIEAVDSLIKTFTEYAFSNEKEIKELLKNYNSLERRVSKVEDCLYKGE